MLIKSRSIDSLFAPGAVPNIVLANRMVLGVATQVQAVVGELFGAPVHSLSDRASDDDLQADVLIVGWRHIQDDLTETFGYDIVGPLARTLDPQVILYVIPSRFRPRAFRADLNVLTAAATQMPVLVLEVAKLSSGSLVDLAALARTQISATRRGQVRLLLPTPGEDDILAEG